MATPARLSKSILDMKFMKRTKEKVLREEEDAKGREMYSSEITQKMLNNDCPFIVETSYVPCEDLNDGRYSFRGMNPEIERLLQLEQAVHDAAQEKNVTKDVSDADMSAYYGNVMKTIEKKYQSKNQRRKITLPEPKFKRPKIDD